MIEDDNYKEGFVVRLLTVGFCHFYVMQPETELNTQKSRKPLTFTAGSTFDFL